MHPYLPHLLRDIGAVHRTEVPEPGPVKSFEQEMEEMENWLAREEAQHTFGYYCGLKSEEFPPPEQLSEKDMKTVCKAFRRLMFSWNPDADLPNTLPPALYYRILIDTMNQKTEIVNPGFMSFDYCSGNAPEYIFKEYCPRLKFWNEKSPDEQTQVDRDELPFLKIVRAMPVETRASLSQKVEPYFTLQIVVMSFIKSFSINATKTVPFPFNIPAVKFAKDIDLAANIIIFVGDNGSGKSTLLESLALYCNLPLIGGHIGGHHGFEAARLIKPFLELEWKRQVKTGFFFRAEDFSDFINSIDRQKQKIQGDLSDLKGVVDDRIIEQMSETANYTLHNIRKNYGDNMQAYSHGEAYFKILETRIGNKGIYLLDEPEAALSPLKQLALIAFILEVIKGGQAQFILATHSPILMGIPGAMLYEITDEGMNKVDYKETEHYRITKTFLDRPEVYLRHL